MSDPVVEKVISIVAAVKKLPPERVTVDSTLEELGLDSLDRVNLLFEVEGAFDISISDEQARSIKSVREVVDGVRALTAKSQA